MAKVPTLKSVKADKFEPVPTCEAVVLTVDLPTIKFPAEPEADATLTSLSKINLRPEGEYIVVPAGKLFGISRALEIDTDPVALSPTTLVPVVEAERVSVALASTLCVDNSVIKVWLIGVV